MTLQNIFECFLSQVLAEAQHRSQPAQLVRPGAVLLQQADLFVSCVYTHTKCGEKTRFYQNREKFVCVHTMKMNGFTNHSV